MADDTAPSCPTHSGFGTHRSARPVRPDRVREEFFAEYTWWHYEHEADTRDALDLIFSDHFNRDEPGIFAPIRDVLLTRGDYYMHLADLPTYAEAQRRVAAVHATPAVWATKSVLNIAHSGRFSSDRTIGEYATGIWNTAPCPVP